MNKATVGTWELCTISHTSLLH